MTKPFDFKELYKKINQLLDKGDAQAGTEKGWEMDFGPVYDLGLLRQMDDRQYLWDRLNGFVIDTPGRIAEMQTAAGQGDFEKLAYWAGRIKRNARVLQAHMLLSLLGKIELRCKGGKDAGDLVQMVGAVYEGLEPLLQEEKEKIGFVLSPEG